MTSLTAGASLRGAGCRLSAAVLALLLATACGGGAPGGEEGHEEEGHVDAVTAPVLEVVDHRVTVPPGGVAAVTLPAFGIHEAVTLGQVTVLTESGDVELLRSAFSDAPVGARCLPEWPSRAAASEEPAVEGARLDDGDAVPVTLYLRPRGGPAVVDELRLTYEVDGGSGELTWRGFRIEVRPARGARCR